jgi:hypothetical protein
MHHSTMRYLLPILVSAHLASARVPVDSELVTLEWLLKDLPPSAADLMATDVKWALSVFNSLLQHEVQLGRYDLDMKGGFIGPANAYAAHLKVPTMGSQERMVWSMALAANVIRRAVPGDIIETGVFKGGSTILLLHATGLLGGTQSVYACDAFAGLPPSERGDFAGCVGQKLAGAQGCQRGQKGDWASSRR